jgi:hypothetical protein
MQMTPVQKGDLGEIAVCKELMKQGLILFKPISNGSRIDLIAMAPEGILKKIQIKSTSSRDGKAILNLRKNTLNPRYNYHYSLSDVDVFALYIEDKDIVCFVTSSEIFEKRDRMSCITFRVEDAKQFQPSCRFARDYALFK